MYRTIITDIPLENRPYQRLFAIVTEGSRTEKDYFSLFRHDPSLSCKIVLVKKDKNKSDPKSALSAMEKYLQSTKLKSQDEAWIVVDKNSWSDEQLLLLDSWQSTQDNYRLAVSNPNFEYWLLLHFEDGNKITSNKDCLNRLKNFLPNYKKEIPRNKLLPQNVHDAIQRAKVHDKLSEKPWPQSLGVTTVYKLLENIISCKF
jgi:hypothetical protein